MSDKKSYDRLEKIHEQEIALCTFNENLRSNIDKTLKGFYGVNNIVYRPIHKGLGIEVTGSHNFNLIRNALVKLSNIPNETLSIVFENEEEACALYAYLPEKDKYIYDSHNK